jgi:predicted lipoprotein
VSARTQRKKLVPRLIGVGALLVLVVAMLLNTKFLTPEEVEALTPDQFSPQETAEELYASVQSEMTEDPAALGDVTAALDEDPDAAAEEFDAHVLSEGAVAFAVSAEGTVEDATADNLTLSVDGVTEGRQIVVPLSSALDGNLIRDISGFRFGDAPGQTDYQRVGTEISSLLRADAQEATGEDPESLIGNDIAVDGVMRYVATDAEGADERPLIIQPLRLEVGP